MMTLISLAIVVALGYSAAVTLGLQGMDFWWELSTLVTIMLLVNGSRCPRSWARRTSLGDWPADSG